MLNALSVDVEEYFHATNLERVRGPDEWHCLPSRVDYSTRKTLDLLARFNTHATFFVLGHVARRCPDLVRDIASAGHEVASHGYAHRLVYAQSPEQFQRDVQRTKHLLEDLSGKKVIGYRAPNFSICDDSNRCYEILAGAGYHYDSSLYPIRHPRYGNRGKVTTPHTVDTPKGMIVVVPLAVRSLNVLGREIRLPIAGGAYWRLLPISYIRWGIRTVNEIESRSCVCYFHPWELDSEQPVYHELSFLTKIRHYGGVKGFEKRLSSLLESFRFAPIAELVGPLRECLQ